MKELNTDVAIIGAGSAGMAAYRAATKAGAKALLIDGGALGTTCARVGCMPSKLLIAAANAAHAAAPETGRLDTFGIRLDGTLRIDGTAVMDRLRTERDRFVGLVKKEIEQFPADALLRANARFLAPTRLSAGNTLVQARAVIIATGATPTLPDEFAPLGDLVATSDTLFEWPALPTRIAVFGTGLIALELGQALSRLGVTVRMFGKGGSLGGLTDPAVAACARQTLGAEFYLDCDADVVSIERVQQGDAARARIVYRTPDGKHRDEQFDRVLVATGRRPQLDKLALDASGLALGKHGVPLFDETRMQCRFGKDSRPASDGGGDGDPAPVFIAGDVDGQRPWLNEAADEGRIAGTNAAAWPDTTSFERSTPLAVVFSDPQMLMCGARFEALDPDTIVAGQSSFDDQGRARIEQVNRGLLRVYADKATRRLLGAEGIAPHAEHFAHLLAWSIQRGATVDELITMPFYHPVFEEGVRSALRDAMARLVETTHCAPPSLADAIGG
ncbi:dihydrolipoyl dehydrogenase [Chitinasiproducens palmae]|uniref:Dihydrolipoamide dehydrogenase n=1 Tax=Chitinasiproducens palmae TaxID=1770053 RepID=A0A1H2PSM8_9BURK|nr:dihydrolipoyl dehydrogenase [Chitinasiproducens palmae]SDV50032.1 dihydrolipoamide dehydrogenase [Chitinasiproducens palmae]